MIGFASTSAEEKNSYFGDWSSKEDLEQDFGVRVAQDADILLAWYSYDNYSGDAFVLFRQNGKLYEVNGSHCSCNGLEDQWEPEATSVKALRRRTLHDGIAQKALTALLDELEMRESQTISRFLQGGLGKREPDPWWKPTLNVGYGKVMLLHDALWDLQLQLPAPGRFEPTGFPWRLAGLNATIVDWHKSEVVGSIYSVSEFLYRMETYAGHRLQLTAVWIK